MKKTRKRSTAILLILALALVACSDSVSESVEDLCNSLEGLNSSLEGIAGTEVDPGTTTIDDIQNTVSQMESAVQEVRDAESDLDEALMSQLQDDFDQLKSSIQGVSGDSTLAEAAQDVVAAITSFRQSWDETLSQLNCSTGS